MQHHHFTGQKTETITSDNTKVNASLLEENSSLKDRIKELEAENKRLKSKDDGKWLCQGSVDAPSSVDSNQSWGVFG